MSRKNDLLREAALQYRAFHEAMHGLNEEQLTEMWLGAWSIRDIIAHIAGWHREMTPALERLASGQRPISRGRELRRPGRVERQVRGGEP